MSMLKDANAATAVLKSFPNCTYTSLTAFSSIVCSLHFVRDSSKALMDTSKRVTADSIAGCKQVGEGEQVKILMSAEGIIK
jgi:hypothetical protein